MEDDLNVKYAPSLNIVKNTTKPTWQYNNHHTNPYMYNL